MQAETLLDEKGIQYKLIRLSSKSINFNDLIKHAASLNLNEVVKTVVAGDSESNCYAFLLRGEARLDFDKVMRELGKKLHVLSIDEIRSVTGMEPGAVFPLLLKMPIYIDKRVLNADKININSLDPAYGIEIKTSDLAKLIHFQVIDVA